VTKSSMIFVSNLFIDAMSKPDYTESNDKMTANCELGRCGRKRSMSNLRYYPRIFSGVLRITIEVSLMTVCTPTQL
jgi:hypothetical protein